MRGSTLSCRDRSFRPGFSARTNRAARAGRAARANRPARASLVVKRTVLQRRKPEMRPKDAVEIRIAGEAACLRDPLELQLAVFDLLDGRLQPDLDGVLDHRLAELLLEQPHRSGEAQSGMPRGFLELEGGEGPLLDEPLDLERRRSRRPARRAFGDRPVDIQAEAAQKRVLQLGILVEGMAALLQQKAAPERNELLVGSDAADRRALFAAPPGVDPGTMAEQIIISARQPSLLGRLAYAQMVVVAGPKQEQVSSRKPVGGAARADLAGAFGLQAK